jgi:hypothetical protein
MDVVGVVARGDLPTAGFFICIFVLGTRGGVFVRSR